MQMVHHALDVAQCVTCSVSSCFKSIMPSCGAFMHVPSARSDRQLISTAIQSNSLQYGQEQCEPNDESCASIGCVDLLVQCGF
jgi:hypothetical protein